MVEVQKLEVFAILFWLARRSAKTRGFCDFCFSSWYRRVAGSIPPWSAGGLRKLHGATCIKQLAQSNLRRASCTDQFAQSNLRRATCTDQFAQSTLPRAEQLAQSNLHRAACTEQLAGSNLHGATCREPLAGTNLHGATCAEQLAQSNLHRATCAEQLAQTNLHRPVCAEHLAQSNLRRATCAEQLAHAATCTEQLAQSNLRRATCACARPGLNKFAAHAPGQEKERILQRWPDLACDVMLSGQPWSSFFFFWGGAHPNQLWPSMGTESKVANAGTQSLVCAGLFVQAPLKGVQDPKQVNLRFIGAAERMGRIEFPAVRLLQPQVAGPTGGGSFFEPAIKSFCLCDCAFICGFIAPKE